MAKTTGSGPFTYRHRDIDIPSGMADNLEVAHGAFGGDREIPGGDGSTWFQLKGVGLMRLDPSLESIEVIGGDPELIDTNIHGVAVLEGAGGRSLALASDESQKVWITDETGHVIRAFENPYGSDESPFKVCDVAFVEGLLYAVNGYADNVCFTADPWQSVTGGGRARWDEFRFGGDGTEHGRFGTAHGITLVPDTNVLTIADRKNSRIETFTPRGRYIGGLALPEGALPCNVDYYDRFAIVPCLRGPGASTPAPIYIYEDGNLVSEINIGRDLGLEEFTHIHNAVFLVNELPSGSTEIFILAYAWNPGGFAILEPVT